MWCLFQLLFNFQELFGSHVLWLSYRCYATATLLNFFSSKLLAFRFCPFKRSLPIHRNQLNLWCLTMSLFNLSCCSYPFFSHMLSVSWLFWDAFLLGMKCLHFSADSTVYVVYCKKSHPAKIGLEALKKLLCGQVTTTTLSFRLDTRWLLCYSSVKVLSLAFYLSARLR